MQLNARLSPGWAVLADADERLQSSNAAAAKLRRRELKWTFEKIDEVSGLQRGYTAKCFHPDTKTGRQAGWPVLQWLARRDVSKPKLPAISRS